MEQVTSDRIIELLEEIRDLLKNQQPVQYVPYQPYSPPSPPWSPNAGYMWQCGVCHTWITYGSQHACGGSIT